MSKTVLVVSGLDGMVQIPLPHGCVLVLTTAEFARGVSRGKALTRARRQSEREARRQAYVEAQRLEWIAEGRDTTGGPHASTTD